MSLPTARSADNPEPTPGELRPLLRLSLPLIAGHVGIQLMDVVDTAMVGRLGAAALGGAGLGGLLWFTVGGLGLGIVLGAETLISQAIGAGDRVGARRAFVQSLWSAVLIGLPLMVLLGAVPLALRPLGIEPGTASEAARCLWARLPQIIPFLLFAACRSYLQSRGITRPVVLAVILSNVLNVGLNSLLIFGDATLWRLGLPGIGLPALGVFGSGVSTTISQIGALLVMVIGVRRALRAEPEVASRLDRLQLARILRIGLPISLVILAEIGAFTIGSVLAGRLGAVASASNQIALTLTSFTFTFTLGIGSAAAVRVGQQVGAGDTKGARRAGFTALLVACGFMCLSASAFYLAAPQLAGLLSSDPVVIRAAVPLLMIVGVFEILDGAQVTAAGALRGAGDTRVAFVANLLGYYAFGLPLAWLLIPHLQARGIWWGLTLGLGTVAVWLVARFAYLSARPIRRV